MFEGSVGSDRLDLRRRVMGNLIVPVMAVPCVTLVMMGFHIHHCHPLMMRRTAAQLHSSGKPLEG